MEQPQPLVCPTHMSHYFFILIISLVLGGAGGAAYGYQKGFGEAKKLVENSVLAPMINGAKDIRTLSGTITAVSGNSFTLRTQSNNPFDDQTIFDRTVTVSANTKIVKLSQKDPKVFQAEMETFASSPSIATTKGISIIPPDPYVRVPGTMQDIQVGAMITVSTDENIKTVKSFEASTIDVQQTLAVPNII